MSRNTGRVLFALVAYSALGLTSCRGGDGTPSVVVPVEPAASESSGLLGLAEQASFADSLLVAMASQGEPDGPYTFFVPRNDDLGAVLARSGRSLDTIAVDKVLASQLLDIHVVGQSLTSEDLQGKSGDSLLTMSGDEVTVSVELATGRLFLETSDGRRIRLIATDLESGLGVVHLVDGPIRVP